MLTHLIDYPVINAKNNPVADTREKKSNPFFSKNFEIQELEEQETYHAQSVPLMHNYINTFVVDWEIPMGER